LATEANIRTNGKGLSVLNAEDIETADPREDLVRSVLASSTFEKSPKLRAFLVYVCRCAIDNQRAAAIEQQIGIHVFGRPHGYNPNDDNIVRSQARLLRLKLEHHFANEGKHERVVITIPKGQYLPSFEERVQESAVPPAPLAPIVTPRKNRFLGLLMGLTVLTLAILWLTGLPSNLKKSLSASFKNIHGQEVQAETTPPARAVVSPTGEVRIAAGKVGDPYIDIAGHRWESDQFYAGGISKPGPQDLFPPVSDPNLFGTIREGPSMESMQPQSEFRYDIPVPAGVYELRLYFADPVRHAMVESGQDAENVRHFQVSANGRRLLTGFDVNADAGSAAVDIRAFKDISPARDGKVHLEFIAAPERPFVSALELTPGSAGKLNSIRLSAHKSDFVDLDKTQWSGDKYYIGGRVDTLINADSAPNVPELYASERFGNFSYAIPVPAGSYTVKLHFLESFFSPLIQSGLCRGEGCRVFDVSCNGVVLLKDFDVFQAAGGAFRPVVRTFHHLHPNGQGKLLLAFTPTRNYAEVRAIEVVDEAQ
jgi:hypothetical protein